MTSTWDYIERVRALNGGCTDYRIAQILGISRTSMSFYKAGKPADEEVSAKIADALGLPRGRVIADIRLSAAEPGSYMASVWQSILAAFPVASPIVVKMPARAQAQSGGAMPTMASADAGMARPTRAKAIRGRSALKISTGYAVEAGVGIEPAYADLQSAA